MRGRMIALLGVIAVLASATPTALSATPPTVRLALAHRYTRAGSMLAATVINASGSTILHAFCATLQRRAGGRWVTVDRSHGFDVSCGGLAGVPQAPHARMALAVPLWDDLAAGDYRIVVRYRFVRPPHFGNLAGPHAHTISAGLTVSAYVPPQPAPALSRARILAIARRAAAMDGDAHPTLIQHAAGTRFLANGVGMGGDLVFAWNWCELIAIRGHFSALTPTPGSGSRIRFTVITLVVDARTGQPLDSGESNTYPRLRRLGPVSTDLGTPG